MILPALNAFLILMRYDGVSTVVYSGEITRSPEI